MSAQSAHTTAPDLGPWYAETDLHRFPSEPANTLSNLVFLVVILLGMRRLRRERIRSAFFTAVLLVLGTGWIGGTIYHATRSSPVWLFMDFVPIGVLCLMAAGWFTAHLAPARKHRYLLLVVPLSLVGWCCLGFVASQAVRISVGYAVLAGMITLPATLHCCEAGWRGGRVLLGAVGAFAVALAFRIYDARLIGPEPRLGTHFLWHLFGGLAAYLILDYLFSAHATGLHPGHPGPAGTESARPPAEYDP